MTYLIISTLSFGIGFCLAKIQEHRRILSELDKMEEYD